MKKNFFILILMLSVTTVVSAQQFQKMSECVIENGTLKSIIIDYDPATGEKSILIGGVRKSFEQVHPKEGKQYAASYNWYINNETIQFGAHKYVKYGLPRVLGTTEITKAGQYKSVNVYVEAGFTGKPEIIYLPVRTGCEFQPYQLVLPPCGTVTIKSNKKEYKKGEVVSLSAMIKGITTRFNYEWETDRGEVIGSATTKDLKLSLKNITGDVNVTVYVSGNGKCAQSIGTITLRVK
jgi:hypothetical protein